MRSMMFLVLALCLAGETRGYGKQGILISGTVDRRKEHRVSIWKVSDGSAFKKPTQHMVPTSSHGSASGTNSIRPSNTTDKAAAKKYSQKLSFDKDAVLMLPHDTRIHRHAVRISLDHVSMEFEGHVSQLDVVTGNPVDTQENAVRRQGVDSALLKYAGLTLSANQQTGVIYDVALPPTLSGIQAQATRLAPATFKQAGLSFNEFSLPTNAFFEPTSEFVVLVYSKILNFTVYDLPSQYQLGGPIVGIISSASNFTSSNPSVSASISLSPNTFINISLPSFSANSNQNALCAYFASNGSIFVSSLVSLPNTCAFSTLGDFALVIQASSTPSPTQNLPPPVVTSPPSTIVNVPPSPLSPSKGAKKWKLIVGATALTLAGVAFLVAVVLISIRSADRCKLFFTSRSAGNEEALQSSLIGNSQTPSAPVMRTKPALEIDMVHFTK